MYLHSKLAVYKATGAASILVSSITYDFLLHGLKY
jgi:hypothetical protein